MATYSIATTAFALGTDRKHIENLLARYPGVSVTSARQGRARKLPRSLLSRLAATMILQRDFGVPVAAGARLVEDAALRWYSALTVGVVSLAIDFPALERSLDAQLAEALEIAPRPRRGRPPKRPIRRL